MSDFTQQQQQQVVSNIHKKFSDINSKIEMINKSTNTILDSKRMPLAIMKQNLSDIIIIINDTKKLVNSTEKIIADTLTQINISDVNTIKEHAQDVINNIHSIWEDETFTGRIDQTIESGHDPEQVHDRVQGDSQMIHDMQNKVDDVIEQMTKKLHLYGKEQLKHYQNTDVFIKQIKGYLEFMENIVDEHIKQLQELLNNPPNSGGKKKRKTKKIKKKAKTKKSKKKVKTKKSKKKAKMKKIKRKTMKKKKSKKHKGGAVYKPIGKPYKPINKNNNTQPLTTTNTNGNNLDNFVPQRVNVTNNTPVRGTPVRGTPGTPGTPETPGIPDGVLNMDNMNNLPPPQFPNTPF